MEILSEVQHSQKLPSRLGFSTLSLHTDFSTKLLHAGKKIEEFFKKQLKKEGLSIK